MSTTAWWAVGFAIGGAVVAIAATLLVTIILLARRIVRQAEEITQALDGARENTGPLFELAKVNHTIESLAHGLKALRGGEGPQDERGPLGRISSLLPGGERGLSTAVLVLAWIGLALGLAVGGLVHMLLNRVLRPLREIKRYADDILAAGLGIARNLDGVDEVGRTRELATALPELVRSASPGAK
jgi:uncharacterized membrane protein YciS (DUF1049 family)